MVVRVQQMCASDLDEVVRIQALAYAPAYLEDRAAFEVKLLSCPRGCFVALLADANGGLAPSSSSSIAGYVFSYPSVVGHIGPLNSPGRPPSEAAAAVATAATTAEKGVAVADGSFCWYTHDLCVDPACRGAGVARALWNAVEKEASIHYGHANMALVSINDLSHAFWHRLGFVQHALIADADDRGREQQRLDQYGTTAMYMMLDRRRSCMQ